jgi:hypothetical protein
MIIHAGRTILIIAPIAIALLAAACGKSSSSPSSPAPAANTAALTITFTENPVPYRTSGCSGATPQGWYTTARVQETAGVAFTPSTLTQKLDGAVSGLLTESFASRFGACSGGTFTPGTITANGTACATIGVCTTGTYGNYQFELSGTDANGHSLTFTSPVLPFSPR